MRVTKDYMERYALLIMIACYDQKLSPLLDGKNENPDWQSESLGIGLEITEALAADDGRIRSVINQYFGRGLSGNYIKNQIETRFPEYAEMVNVVEDTACFSQSGDMGPKIERVIQAIAEKTDKLNDHYQQLAQNWLFVFAPDLFSDYDLPEVSGEWARRTTQYSKQFDKVFLLAIDRLFVLTSEGLERDIPIFP